MRARDNPFAVDRVLSVRYKPQGWTWDELLARLAQLRYRAAIVGPKGSGKTTLLEDLGRRLTPLGWQPLLIRLDSQDRRLDTTSQRRVIDATKHTILLLDGAEQLTRLGWWQFCRQSRGAAGVIITSHRAGRLPTLVRTQTSLHLLNQILTELGTSCPDAPALYARYGGNLRDALRALYDRRAGGHC